MHRSSTSDGWTFGVCVGPESPFLNRTIESILDLRIPNSEILVVSDWPVAGLPPDVRNLHVGGQRKNWITRKKNEVIRNALYERICLLHDYIYFDPRWYIEWQNFGDSWNVATNQIRNPFSRNRRVADWMSLDHPWLGVALLPYRVRSLSKYMFLSGIFFCVKKSFIVENGLFLNEDLVWGQAEDQEWSRRVRKVSDFSLVPKAIVFTQKDKRFEALSGWVLLRRLVKRVLIWFQSPRPPVI